MLDQSVNANGRDEAREVAADDALITTALREFDGIGMREILDQDSRPTFLLDLDPDVEFPLHTDVLSPFFCNASLRTYERLWDVVRGAVVEEEAEIGGELTALSQYGDFNSWVTRRTKFDESGDIFPSTHVFFGMLWTGSTVRKRWRLISGNKCYQLPHAVQASLASGPPIEAAGTSNAAPSVRSPHKRRRSSPSSPELDRSPERTLFSPSGSGGKGGVDERLATSINIESMAKSSSQQPTLRTSNPRESSCSSVTGKSNASISLDAEHTVSDWTTANLRGSIPAHIKFARSINWASTPLGKMSTWSAELKQVANLVMKMPHPAALFWGNDLTAMYNEAYKDVIAGRKHPALMGTGLKGPFSETWDLLADLFANCAKTGNSIAMENQQLPIERHGFLEETYFTWSFTPLYGGGSKVLGFYNSPFETTNQVVTHRRMHTLLRLGEETSVARTVSDFWPFVLRGLEENHFDVPVAIMYSVFDSSDDDETSQLSGSSMSLKSCLLEGSLGIPEGHVAAPARLDLKRSNEGFVPSFREAMRTREPTRLQTRDGSLPESLLAGIEWRGFGDPCREAIIFPVRPTNGENVMAFLLIGINPRRPFDDSYKRWVNLLNHQLATGLASIILFEEEIRRGQTAAEAAAKEREQLSAQLEAQTIRLQRMAETSQVGMYHIDSQGRLVEANERYYQITGLARDLADTDMHFYNIVHPDSTEVVQHAWHLYTVEHKPWSGEIRIVNPWTDPVTGEVLESWVLAGGQPEYWPDGSFRHCLGSFTDISRIKWAEGLQARRLKEAEETRRQMNNFLDLTSHEMRNPLSAMIHCADEIQEVLNDIVPAEIDLASNVPDAAAKPSALQSIQECIEAAETIALCAQHQKSIVDDILTVSKLDSDLLVITPSIVQPADVARRAVKIFDTELQKKDIKCTYLVDSSLSTLAVDSVHLDHSRLVQILINLLTNAIKFTQDKAKRAIIVRVGASLQPSTPEDADFEYIAAKNLALGLACCDGEEWGNGELLYLHFKVTDTGRGLTKEEKKKLFLRFSQATPRTHAQYGGSGLGLFISRQLTELHGGLIGVGSEAGVGSTFAFYIRCRRAVSVAAMNGIASRSEHDHASLPLNRPRENLQLRADRPTNASVLPSPPLLTPPLPNLDPTKLHVLIVEDNAVNQKVLRKQLAKLGCNVEVADHGAQALAYIERTRYWRSVGAGGRELTVVLMDLEMPVMDGLTAVKNIRRKQSDGTIVGHVPVIAVTANVRSELVSTARESGMDDVLSKPFRIPELMAKIAEVLDRAKG